jgi:hypothetical protein
MLSRSASSCNRGSLTRAMRASGLRDDGGPDCSCLNAGLEILSNGEQSGGRNNEKVKVVAV